MPVSLSRRVGLLLVILVSLVIFRCSNAGTGSRGGNCPPAPVQKYAPVINVTKEGAELKATPRVAIIWDFEPVNPTEPGTWKDGESCHKPSGKNVQIVWRGPDGLHVKFTDPGQSCVTPPVCKGGECRANVRPLQGKPSTRCTYEMYTGEVKDEDADIVVTPCCW